MRIYLCSRTAKDAHATNLKVAKYLRMKGHVVFLPQEADYNLKNSEDEEIYQNDMAQMLNADACVVVEKIGVDCSFEVGWFQGMGVPTVWLQDGEEGRHPMLHKVKKVTTLTSVASFLDRVERRHTKFAVLSRGAL